jgi:phage terminase large subunit
VITFPHDFEPREYQRPFMRHFIGQPGGPKLDGAGKRATWVVHRRGGKDLTGMHTLNICAHRRRGAYWHTFPTFEQGRKAIWEGFTKDGKRIIDNVFPAAFIKSRDNQQMKIELKCGSIYRIVGTDKIETVGAGPVGVLHSEYSIAKPSAADLIAPMLRENDGWEAYVYTPRGNNHGKKRFDSFQRQAQSGDPRYFAELLTLFDTKAYDPETTLREERANGRPEALIRQEYLCDWTAANVGAVFGDLLPEAVEFDHAEDGVYTSWDLGVSDATAIWFWRLNGDGVDFIDHYEATGRDAAHFIGVLKGKKYDYVRHYLPHDGRNRTWVTSATPLTALEEHWLGKVEVLPQESLANGIESGRWLLQRGTRFHTRCSEGIEALKAYHYEWDDDRKVLARTPMHDWSSHTADAFRYAASVVKFTGLVDAPIKPSEPPDLPMIIDVDGTPHLNRTFKQLADATIRSRPRRNHV